MTGSAAPGLGRWLPPDRGGNINAPAEAGALTE
jgi:hypothetical protein